jgi:hypothetical protein
MPDCGKPQGTCATSAAPAVVASPAAATAYWVATAGLSTYVAADVVAPMVVIEADAALSLPGLSAWPPSKT